MKLNRHHFSLALALVIILGLAVQFPPAGSWRGFMGLGVPAAAKAAYLARLYLLPFGLAFLGMVCLQLSMRVAMSPAPASSVFVVAVIAWGLFTEVIFGAGAPESRPAYVAGMALAVTMMSRVVAVTMPKRWFGMPFPRVVWRADKAGVAELRKRVAEQRAAEQATQEVLAR